MTSTSPEPADRRPRVTVIDRRRLIREGLESLLSRSGTVDCAVHHDPADAVAVVGDPPAGWAPTTYRAVVWIDFSRPVWALVDKIASSNFGPGDRVVPAAGADRFDERDRTILAAARHGASTQEIALRLDVSVRTAERYKQSLFRRLGARSQAHAVAVATDRGLLPTY